MGRRDQLHALQFLEPALGLLGLGGFGPEAAYEAFDFRHPLLLLGVLGLLLGQAFRSEAFKGAVVAPVQGEFLLVQIDRKSTRLNSSHVKISYAVFCLKKKKNKTHIT